MSQAHHPDFTAFGAIEKTCQVMREEFKFFAIIIVLYALVSSFPFLFYSGLDFANLAEVMERMNYVQSNNLAISLINYSVVSFLIINILDRTNANLNNYSVKEYPYVERALYSFIPVSLIFIISWILITLGLVLLIVPGLIVIAGLYLATPLKLDENVNFISALQKSWVLSKGHRLSIWGVILLPLIPILIIFFILNFIITGIFISTAVTEITIIATATVYALITGTISVFMLTASGVVYHQISNEVIDEEMPFN